MTLGRSLGAIRWILLMTILSLSLSAVPKAFGSALVDPFREAFLVGLHDDPGDIPMDGAWPRDLFAPAAPDSAWLEAAQAYFHGGRRRAAGLTGWRLLRGAMDARDVRRRYETLAARAEAVAGRAAAVERKSTWLAADLLELDIRNAWNDGDCESVVRLTDAAVEHAEDRGDVIGMLLMSVRRRAAMDAAGVRDDADTATIWAELPPLRAADARSGWALWTAHRRAIGAPLLPPGCGSDDLARWLLAVPRIALDAGEIDRAGFSAEAACALGLKSFAAGERAGPRMTLYLEEHPMPVADVTFQWAWLMARRGNGPRTAQNVARLASVPGVLKINRSRLLGLEADRLLTNGKRDAALELLISGSEGGAGGPLALQFYRCAVQALASARADESLRVAGIAQDHLDAAVWRPYAERLESLNGGGTADGSWPEAVRFDVRRGGARPVRMEIGAGFASRLAVARARAWSAWLDWGAALADSLADTLPAAGSEAAFLVAVRTAGRADTHRARFGLGCDALGKWLSGLSDRDILLDWAQTRDLERLAGAEAIHAPSPLPRLVRRGGGDGETPAIRRFALCGIGLALGDGRGQIAAAFGAAMPGLDWRRRLLLTHPLPSDAATASELAAGGLDPSLVLAVARRESLFDAAARSRAGALGLMQIMPFHYPGRGFVDGAPIWRRPVVSLRKGISLLRENAARFDRDPYATLSGYNAGPGPARRWRRQIGSGSHGGFLLAWAGYAETRRYMEQVLIDRQAYVWILNGWPPGGPEADSVTRPDSMEP